MTAHPRQIALALSMVAMSVSLTGKKRACRYPEQAARSLHSAASSVVSSAGPVLTYPSFAVVRLFAKTMPKSEVIGREVVGGHSVDDFDFPGAIESHGQEADQRHQADAGRYL